MRVYRRATTKHFRRPTAATTMTGWLSTVVILSGLCVSTIASAQDFEEYERLTNAAAAAHDQLEDASADLVTPLQDNAVQRDLAVIAWLDAFFSTPAFESLPMEARELAFQDRYRYEYNATRLMIELDRCEEARNRLRVLLDSAVNDSELRPRLTETYDASTDCMNRVREAYLTVAATPADAQVMVDGTFVGLANVRLPLELGDHTITVRADGYEAQEFEVSAEAEGQEIEVGPADLVQILVVTGKPPTIVEWTLWGTGVVGIGVGIGYFIAANSRQDDIDNPPEGQIVVDQEGEQSQVDTMRTISYIAGGLGLAAAITGTVLYFTRDAEGEPVGSVSWGPTWMGDAPGFAVGGTF